MDLIRSDFKSEILSCFSPTWVCRGRESGKCNKGLSSSKNAIVPHIVMECGWANIPRISFQTKQKLSMTVADNLHLRILDGTCVTKAMAAITHCNFVQANPAPFLKMEGICAAHTQVHWQNAGITRPTVLIWCLDLPSTQLNCFCCLSAYLHGIRERRSLNWLWGGNFSNNPPKIQSNREVKPWGGPPGHLLTAFEGTWFFQKFERKNTWFHSLPAVSYSKTCGQFGQSFPGTSKNKCQTFNQKSQLSRRYHCSTTHLLHLRQKEPHYLSDHHCHQLQPADPLALQQDLALVLLATRSFQALSFSENQWTLSRCWSPSAPESAGWEPCGKIFLGKRKTAGTTWPCVNSIGLARTVKPSLHLM